MLARKTSFILHRATFLLVFLFILLSSSLSICQAADTQIVRVGWFKHPISSVTRSDAYSGYNYDYLLELSKYTNWQYRFIDADLDTCRQMLQNGEIDLMCGLYLSPERTKIYDYAKRKYGHVFTTMFTARGSKLKPYDFTDYPTLHIGLLTGAVFSKNALANFADSSGFKYNTHFYATPDDLNNAIHAGNIDAGILETYTIDPSMKVLAEFEPRAYYFATTKGNSKILNALNNALDTIEREDPSFEQELYKHHFSTTANNRLTADELHVIKLSQDEPITVGVIEKGMPLCVWNDKQKSFVGLSVEMMNAVSKKTGLKFRPVRIDLTKNSPVGWLKNNNIRIVMGVYKTQNFLNDKSILLSNPLHTDSIVVIGRKGEDFTTNPSHKTITTIKGFQVGLEYMAKQFPQHTILRYDTIEECMDALADGRAHAVFWPGVSSSYMMQNPHYENFEIVTPFTYNADTCMVGRINNSELIISIINKGLAMISEIESNSIMTNYTIVHPYELSFSDILYKYKLPIIIISVLLIIIIVILIQFYRSKQKSRHFLEIAYEEKKQAYDRAELASSAKGEFVSRLSHEIRTPLNALIGYNTIASNTINGVRSPEDYTRVCPLVSEYLQKSAIAAKHLITIINDVLDISSIESGKLLINEKTFSLSELAKSMNALFLSQAKAKGVAFKIDMSNVKSDLFIGDSLHLNQIITNLLSNALKFTPAGGRITLTISHPNNITDPNLIRFDVTDTGIGISNEHLQRIWQPFEQADHTIAEKYCGTGLGLHITKNLVELMDGTITVNSTLGAGSSFTVYLHLQPCKQNATQNTSAAEAYDFTGTRMLVAEDNQMNMEITKLLLTSAGITVDGVSNGAEAVARFCESSPGTYDLILMDIQMPEMDGNEATRAIRASAHPQAKSIPIFAMTADVFADKVAATIEAGMNEHIAKPLDMDTLFAAISKYLHN